MSHVFVLDTNKQPLPPVHAGWARILLTRGKAAVFRRYPFTIILKEALPAPQAQGLQLKIDPGSKMTGQPQKKGKGSHPAHATTQGTPASSPCPSRQGEEAGGGLMMPCRDRWFLAAHISAHT